MRHLFSFTLLFLGLAPFGVQAAPGDLHGPICSWHLDPTSTITIQWIERTQFTIPQERWWEAKSGFGYGDNDDTTVLDMQDKYQRLYIRRQFEAKDLPSVAEIDVTGKWEAITKIDKKDYTLTADLVFEDEKLSGTIDQGIGTPSTIDSGYVSGQNIHFTVNYSLLGLSYRVEVSAKPKDDHFEGEWKAFDKNDKEVAKDSLTLKRILTEEEKQKSEEERKKEAEAKKKEADQIPNPEAFQMELRIRYDDAFIAYLNGIEIHRQGVEEGRGKEAKGIKDHDAAKEETFVIDKEFNRHLKSGHNILAIEGHNRALDSSDFTLDPKFWVRVDKKELKYLDGNDDWIFFLGDPPDSWTTAEIKAKPLPLLPNNLPTFNLRYGKRGQASLPNAAKVERLPFADTRQIVHRVILRNLDPATEYGFEIAREESSDRVTERNKYFFETAPLTLTEPLTFVTGGDMYHKRNLLDQMNREAARHQPLFALLGGDLAYANGVDAQKWYNWVDSWHDWCVNTSDTMIPMIAVIGNHECSKEVRGLKDEELKDYKPEENAKFYYSLFPLSESKSNYTVDFGDYMSIVCLDSNHTQTPEAQAPWLKDALGKRQGVPNLFACYHRPTYGTLVKDDEADVRKHFVPLFDAYGVDIAFENDHHLYKRTFPLKGDEIDPAGTLYIGDGSWGVDLRDIPWEKANKLPYLARAAKENHLIRVQLHPNRQQLDAYNGKGEKIDSTVRFR